jgi:hypothetical protein
MPKLPVLSSKTAGVFSCGFPTGRDGQEETPDCI